MAWTPHRAFAGTPYEAQLGGQIHATLRTLIIAEFGGPPSREAVTRRICQPDDYEVLKEWAKHDASLSAFGVRCGMTEFISDRSDNTRIEHIAYLPVGYCEILKPAIEKILSVIVRLEPSKSRHSFNVNHRNFGVILQAKALEPLRGADVITSCRSDGSLHVSATAPTPHPSASASFEGQAGRVVGSVIWTAINGEFGGWSPSRSGDHTNRRICLPDDYEALKVAVKDYATLLAFNARCKLIEFIVDQSDARNVRMESIAYLPLGYCNTLRVAFERVLAESVEATARGSRGANRYLLDSADFVTSCQKDGSLHVSAKRKPRP